MLIQFPTFYICGNEIDSKLSFDASVTDAPFLYPPQKAPENLTVF